MNNYTGSATIKEFVGFKPKMYSRLIDDNIGIKKQQGRFKRNIVAKISHYEYNDVLLNNKCLKHSINRIQTKDHRRGTYEISKISLSCPKQQI